ncbi:IS3 family transposase [Xylanibacillus composti]|nr:IS3 family transposase [Xylanibacillus composti]MDT9725078.1 IS3 family transposase [Xylanibacillus composti]MDT9726420.1 IS3 family transposase [Xylanibacillus composti]MDT9726424.1 IS3 family transposase [Xylanibacillus composti]MDT9726434.1 IS3 family transposase [Xylanibacillus composti]
MEDRLHVAQTFIRQGHIAATVLAITGVSSSTYYERKKRDAKAASQGTVAPVLRPGRPLSTHSRTQSGQIVSDAQIEEWLMELTAGEEHGYGYLLLNECLRNQHALVINKKKTYRLCKKLGLLHPQRRKITHYPRRLARNADVRTSNEQWQLDIKYGYVAGYDQFFYIADMIDVFDRTLVGHHIGSCCEAKDVCRMVRAALDVRLAPGAKPPVIRTDNGPQFVSKAFGELCAERYITHERIPPKTPNMNAYIESFHATLERDLLSKETFDTFQEAYEAVENYIEFYNNRRMHRSLGKRSPALFMAWAKTKTPEELEPFKRTV